MLIGVCTICFGLNINRKIHNVSTSSLSYPLFFPSVKPFPAIFFRQSSHFRIDKRLQTIDMILNVS